MSARSPRSARTLVVTLLVVLQFFLQPAAVLAAVTGVGGPSGAGGDCSGCCSAPAPSVEMPSTCCSVPVEPAPSACCCCSDVSASEAPLSDTNPDGIALQRRPCDCAAPPASVPLAPVESFKGTAAASANDFVDPRTPLPGVIEVERFGVHGVARARAPGLLRGLNVLHQVYRI